MHSFSKGMLGACACVLVAAHAAAASSGDVLCAAGDAEIARCAGADGTVYAHAIGESLNDSHWVDVTVVDQPSVCQVRCDVTITWAGGSETLWEVPPGSYPSHDVPADPTLVQLFCFCK